jgi:hypothetical protein
LTPILAGGSSGIAVIGWAGDSHNKTIGKSSGGKVLKDIKPKY